MKLDWERPTGRDWEIYAATIRNVHEFSRLAAPTLFTWVEWCALLAVLRYAQLQTGLWPLTAIQWVLGIALWGYFMSLGSSPAADWLPRSQLLSAKGFATMLLSFSATAALMWAAFWLASVFLENPL